MTHPTTTHAHTVELGEVIAAAFDWAARRSTDPFEVSRLATEAVLDLLGRVARHAHAARVRL